MTVHENASPRRLDGAQQFAAKILGRGRVYETAKHGISTVMRNRRVQLRRLPATRYLQLGCGGHIADGFINLDWGLTPGVDLCWDATRSLPFPDQSLDGIFTEHMLEHVPLTAGLRLLRECRRVLRPGGILRVIVPDGRMFVDDYMNEMSVAEQPGDLEIGALPTLGLSSPMLVLNRIFYGYGHRCIYDFSLLREVLQHAGFAGIERCSFRVGHDETLLIDQERRASESLYAEARPS